MCTLYTVFFERQYLHSYIKYLHYHQRYNLSDKTKATQHIIVQEKLSADQMLACLPSELAWVASPWIFDFTEI